MFGRFFSLLAAACLLAACAVKPSAELPAASGETPEYGPSEEAMVAGGFATGAVLALIAVAAIAGTATLVFVSDP